MRVVDGQLTIDRYWQAFSASDRSPKMLVEELRAARESVDIHLRSDAPLGAFSAVASTRARSWPP